MRKLSGCVGVLGGIFLACVSVLAQQVATTPVTIRVSDPTGTGISHAHVRLVPAPDNAPEKLETDDKGQLSIHLKAGDYAVFASAQGFASASQHVEISIPKGQAGTVQTVPVVLQVGKTFSPTVRAGALDSLLLNAAPYHSSVAISRADFAAIPHVTSTVHNAHTDATETYSGVSLAALLGQVNAPLGKELRGEAMTTYVIATGTDGYSVVFSLAEVDPSFHGGQIIVADTREGKPLGKSGPFQLIVSDDKRPARWVHNLDSITLQRY